ncbi:hypothetical protein QSJ19_01095 [Gordonia sp. ABSL11-1]|nr:hypothetical protein [Gordonia sp. ABSL11-1]MDL9944198.1 hypothetical protein [Gordonia sp. ABSL11-1]
MTTAVVLCAILAAAGVLVWRRERLNDRAEEHNTMTGRTGPDESQETRTR